MSALGVDAPPDRLRQLRSAPRQFAVVPGHEELDLETVIERHDSYVVVEKLGLGAQVAERLDPRGGQEP